MNKFLLSCALLSAAAYAQAQNGVDIPLILDQNEDTTQQVVTIADIVSVQEKVTTSNTTISHFNSVWGRKKYFSITYGGVDMTSKEPLKLGYDNFNNGVAPSTFKADWSAAMKLGRNYNLHKKPIANTLMFNIHFNYFDLNFTHFKAEGQGKEKLYDSSTTWKEVDEEGGASDRKYIPWCLEKYKADFGMAVGPSLTIAPFNYISGVPGLHFVKIDVYYTIGYHASLLWMANDDKRDANPKVENSSSTSYLPGKDDTNTIKLNWGHGLTSTFGFNLSWKAIGVGYEIRTTNLTYKSCTPGIYGHAPYKFDTQSNRIYLTIRY